VSSWLGKVCEFMDTVDGERGCWQVVDVFAAEGYIYRGTVQVQGGPSEQLRFGFFYRAWQGF